MTREETKKYFPYIQAFAEGKTIQMQVITNNGSEIIWKDVNEPNFHLGHIYRVKPEPKYRPFKSKEECWNEMLKHKPFGWVAKESEDNYVINAIGKLTVTMYDDSANLWPYDYNDVFRLFKFVDGQPFGIKENE